MLLPGCTCDRLGMLPIWCPKADNQICQRVGGAQDVARLTGKLLDRGIVKPPRPIECRIGLVPYAGMRSIRTPEARRRIVAQGFIATIPRRNASMSCNQQNDPSQVPAATEAEEIDRREQSLDDALRGTFPASDPPAALAPHATRNDVLWLGLDIRDGLDYPHDGSISKT